VKSPGFAERIVSVHPTAFDEHVYVTVAVLGAAEQ
jgi:hypothetical protein